MTSPFHPELRFAARWLPRGVVRSWSVDVLARLRLPSVLLPRGITVTVQRLEGTSAAVRILRPARAGSARPVVLWIHGGGYVIGSAAQDDRRCARLALELDAVVVSVDYRLASKHPFPAPLDDCVAAWEWVHRSAAELGVDPTRAVIAGMSAGGGLAAGLVLRLRDRARPLPRLQVLIYPMLDDRTALRAVDERNLRAWDSASNRVGWSRYLGHAPGPAVSDHAAAARCVDLRGLPPAWIGVGTLDLFHDEDVAYAERLREAGVATELAIVPGAFHAFDALVPRAEVSRRFVASYRAAIARALS